MPRAKGRGRRRSSRTSEADPNAAPQGAEARNADSFSCGGKVEDEDPIFARARRVAFEMSVEALRRHVSEVTRSLNASTIGAISAFVRTSAAALSHRIARGSAGSGGATPGGILGAGAQIPTALVFAGINVPDHARVFGQLADELSAQGVGEHVVVLRARQCGSMRRLLLALIEGLIGIRVKVPDMDVICGW